MFEQAFKNIDDTLWKDAGASNELDYVEQTSWILFLKYLIDLDTEKRSMERSWKKRGKEIERVIMSTSGMYGDLQGIVGASLPSIKSLELPSGEKDDDEVEI